MQKDVFLSILYQSLRVTRSQIQEPKVASGLFTSSSQVSAAATEELNEGNNDIFSEFSYFGQKNLHEFLEYLVNIGNGFTEKTSLNLSEIVKYLTENSLDEKELFDPEFFKKFIFNLNLYSAQRSDLSENSSRARFTPTRYQEREKDISGKFPLIETEAENAESSSDRMVTYFSETIGKRATQEDAFIIGQTNDEEIWQDTQKIPNLLRTSFQDFGKRIRCSGKLSGSTALVTHRIGNILTIANLGDSRSVLFFKFKNGDVSHIRLTEDQKPENFFETSRINTVGGAVVFIPSHKMHRVNASLAMARSFGDIALKDIYNSAFVISYEPDLFQIDLEFITKTINEKSATEVTESNEVRGEVESMFLVNSCDGLYETVEESYYDILLRNWFADQNLRNFHQNNLAEFLRNSAYEAFSEDNITVCVTDVTEPAKVPQIIGVFDGHSGDFVSNAAAKFFHHKFLDARNSMIEGKITKEIKLDEIYSLDEKQVERYSDKDLRKSKYHLSRIIADTKKVADLEDYLRQTSHLESGEVAKILEENFVEVLRSVNLKNLKSLNKKSFYDFVSTVLNHNNTKLTEHFAELIDPACFDNEGDWNFIFGLSAKNGLLFAKQYAFSNQLTSLSDQVFGKILDLSLIATSYGQDDLVIDLISDEKIPKIFNNKKILELIGKLIESIQSFVENDDDPTYFIDEDQNEYQSSLFDLKLKLREIEQRYLGLTEQEQENYDRELFRNLIDLIEDSDNEDEINVEEEKMIVDRSPNNRANILSSQPLSGSLERDNSR